MRSVFFSVCCGVILFIASTSIAADFPHRGNYPEVSIIELTDLKSGYDRDEFIIVDVRSKTEFETIHIENAMNVSYGRSIFTRDLSRIARQNLNKKIVLYDNGIDCIKSFVAAEQAFDFASILNVYVFDAGISAWAKAYPSSTLFLGGELKNFQEQLISEEQFFSKNLGFDTFAQRAKSGNAIIIDLRDPIQRKGKLPGLENVLFVPVDKLVRNIIKKGHMKDKKLFLFDQVGGQTKWLMYYLVDNGYTDFYFLNGGAASVLKDQDYRVTVVH